MSTNLIPAPDDIKAAYDWQCAFYEAVHGTYKPYDDDGPVAGIVEVIAAVDGDNDGPEWLGVFLMDDHRYAVVSAGCDYTGWDCQAGGTIEFYQSADLACSKVSLGDEQRERLSEQLREQEAAGRVKLDWDDESKGTT